MDLQEQILRGVIAGVVTAIISKFLHRLWRSNQERNRTEAKPKPWVILKWLLNPDALALAVAILTLLLLRDGSLTPFKLPPPALEPIYVVVATVLVYFMQFGFIAFEAGAARRTYGFESAVKNLLVFIVAYASYIWPGTIIHAYLDPDFLQTEPIMLRMAFNAGFASTIALIVANTATERTSLPANLVLSIVSAGVGYPFLAGLMWGNGWLAQRGFVDTAGGCVVHLLGGCIGLFAAYRIGPRFRTQGWQFLGKPPKPDQRALIPLTVVGGLFLWFGWLGFNSGSAHGQSAFIKAFFNTSLGACGGGFAAIFMAVIPRFYQAVKKNTRLPLPLAQMADLERVLIGMMGGLVCVTANASLVEPFQAFVESIAGGFVTVGITALISRYADRFDDPLAAVATHAGAGFVGVVVFTPLWVSESRFLVQLMGCGIAVVCAWILASVVCVCFLTLKFFLLGKPAGLLESMVGNFRLRLSASRQVTGKMGFESWGAEVQVGQALSIVRAGPRAGANDEPWRSALGELAMIETPSLLENALYTVIGLLEEKTIPTETEAEQKEREEKERLETPEERKKREDEAREDKARKRKEREDKARKMSDGTETDSEKKERERQEDEEKERRKDECQALATIFNSNRRPPNRTENKRERLDALANQSQWILKLAAQRSVGRTRRSIRLGSTAHISGVILPPRRCVTRRDQFHAHEENVGSILFHGSLAGQQHYRAACRRPRTSSFPGGVRRDPHQCWWAE